jgi:hypothetical protein
MRLLKITVALGIGLFVAADHTRLAANRGIQSLHGKWQMVSSRHPGPRSAGPASHHVSGPSAATSDDSDLPGTVEKNGTLASEPQETKGKSTAQTKKSNSTAQTGSTGPRLGPHCPGHHGSRNSSAAASAARPRVVPFSNSQANSSNKPAQQARSTPYAGTNPTPPPSATNSVAMDAPGHLQANVAGRALAAAVAPRIATVPRRLATKR